MSQRTNGFGGDELGQSGKSGSDDRKLVGEQVQVSNSKLPLLLCTSETRPNKAQLRREEARLL
jgi:hypothetical protein